VLIARARCRVQAATGEAPAAKLWGGRFTGKTDPLMEKFNESLPFDKRMWAEDIRVRSGRWQQTPHHAPSICHRRVPIRAAVESCSCSSAHLVSWLLHNRREQRC
jgi:hypothetical protein